jgi:hypothetical protein
VAALKTSLNWPSLQSTHASSLASRYLPGTHAAVGDAVGAFVGESVGALVGVAVGTATHTVAPTCSFVQAPAAQSSHAWYTSEFWNLPDGQWSQLVCWTIAAILPASQSVHSPPVVAWYLPASQSVHSVADADAYWPLSQAVQTSALYVLLNSPALHGWHTVTTPPLSASCTE